MARGKVPIGSGKWEEYLQALGDRIRRYRAGRGMTQKELGMAAGMGPAYMGMVESGKQNLSLETIWKLAQGLELSVELLLSEDDIWAEPTEKSVKQLIRAVENMATELSRLRGQEGELVKTADGLLQAGRKLLEQFGESTSRRDPKSHK